MTSIVDSNKKQLKRKLRNLSVDILVIIFIIMIYFYLSEIYGSISTPYMTSNSLEIIFGISLFFFTLFSILTGPIQAFISGFLGELFYQLAFYDTIIIYWCLIVGVFGLINGFYKYMPLKYQKMKNPMYTSLILLLNSIIIVILVISFQFVLNFESFSINEILVNFGLKMFIQCIFSILIFIPFVLFIYDRFLARQERHIYNIFLTHHPVEASDHTFRFQFGRTYIYLCSRCSGMVIGLILSLFFIHVVEMISDAIFDSLLALILVIILPIPGLIDWGTQRLLLRDSSTSSRVFTGFIIGVAMNLVSYTRAYYFFTLMIIALYFSILFVIIYFGQKRLLQRLDEELTPQPPEMEQEAMKPSRKNLKIIFLHGLESSGEGFKAKLLRKQLPGIMTPTFEPYNPKIPIERLLQRRMAELNSILDLNDLWIIIGSSFGGLMATIYAMENPEKVYKMILLAPYLKEEYLHKEKIRSLDLPVIIYYGSLDTVVDPNISKKIASKYFNHLTHHLVNDDHSLHSTVQSLDWKELTNLK